MKVYNVLKNMKDYTDRKMSVLGSYSFVSGTMRSAAWSSPTSTTTWTAPEAGIYIMTMSIGTDSDADVGQIYKQFRWTGTATNLLQEVCGLYFRGDSVTGQGINRYTWSFPVSCVEGDTVSSFIWTPTAILYNVKIVGVKVGELPGAGASGGAEPVPDFVNPYPVGAIYLSVSPTNPTTLFGGTWERIQDTFLLASGNTYDAGATGGEATHTLTKNEMPVHGHSLNAYASSSGGSGGGVISYNNNAGGAQYIAYDQGGGQAHNNMPPYLAVYVWKRIA